MKRNSLYKILNTFFVIALTTFVFVQEVGAVSLADPADQFVVTSPGPNSRVSGVVNTIWRVSDDEQSKVPYEINLLDTANCTRKIATVASGSATSSNGTITTSWNSAGSFPQVAKINDGSYCMQVCVSLRNGKTPYSACNGRIITIRNTNRAPVIATNPPASREISSAGSFTYDVNATDPDGDPISYILLSNPGFVSINSATGLITTSQSAKPAGTYSVTLQVRDSLGATAQQTFDLKIVGASTPITPSTPTTPSSTTTTPAPDKEPTVNFISPVANEVLAGKTNEIKWEVKNGAEVSEIVISYSENGADWQQLTTVPTTSNSYIWDVSALKDGQYSLQILLKTSDGHEFRKQSDTFTIKNTVDPNDLITKPLIVDVTPSDGANIRDRRPLITGTFTPPIDGTIDVSKFKFTFDDQDATSKCEVTPAEFKCTLDSDLNLGVHKAKAEIQDFKQQVAEKEWSFTIIEGGTTTSQPGENQGDGIFIGDRFIPKESLVWGLLICCGALLLLLIPWVIYSIWRRREENEITRTEVNVTADPYAPVMPEIGYTTAQPDTPVTPEVNVNYYYPEYTTPAEPTDLSAFQPEVVVNTETVPVSDQFQPIGYQNVTTFTPATEPFAEVRQDNPSEAEIISEPITEPQSEVAATPEPSFEPTEPDQVQSADINVPAPVVADSDPLAPAESAPQIVINTNSTEVNTSSDPLAPAQQPDWLNASPSTITASDNGSQPGKKDDSISSYGYGTKID